MNAAWLLPLALLAAEPAPPAEPAPSWADRLAWNARERTAKGLEEIAAGRPEEALPAFDTALRLRPADPLSRFNAGTARLEARQPDAAPLLEAAAERAGSDLAPAAWYNLGNARLGAGDPAAAIEAFREALRREPAHLPSKHNLELALRELEKQRQQQQQQQQEQQQQQDQQQQEQQQQQEGESDESQRDSEQRPDPSGQEEPESPPSESPAPPAPPKFEDQPDMTAQQAAALLQAVEDLERQQRRERALDQARRRARVEKDW